MITVSEFNENIADKLHGTTLDNVWNYKGIVKQAISRVLSRVDPPETKAETVIDSGIIDGIEKYKAPKDLKSNKIIRVYKAQKDCRGDSCLYEDVEHQSNYYILDNVNRGVAIDTTNNKKTIKVNSNFLTGCSCDTCKKALIHSMDTFDCDFCSDKGCPPEIKCTSICDPCQEVETCTKCPLWSVTGIATGLNIDCRNFLTGRGSVNVDLKKCEVSNGNGSVVLSDLCPHSITCYSCGYYVVSADICGAKDLITMKLRYGSSNLDYHEVEVNSFEEGWQFIHFNLDKKITVGFPDLDNISYYEFIFSTNGNPVNIKLDSLFISKQSSYNIVYYRDHIFKDSNGNLSKTWTSETDIINLDDDTINLITYEVMLLVSQSISGGDSSSDVNFYSALLKDEYAIYTQNHKSEIAPIIHYYA